MFQLPIECLYEILECLEDDEDTLSSCLLVNRLWCEIAVRILWRNVWNYSTTNVITLISCLPNESKKILYKNGIIISAPTSKTPLFNYAAFCKELSINKVNSMIEQLLKSQQNIQSRSISNNTCIIAQELHKLFMKQIPSLKKLYFWDFPNINFTIFPESKDCLKNLSELYCSSSLYSEFFCQLSQICHNLSLLNIRFGKVISNGLIDLISAQRNLKCLGIVQCDDCKDLTDIIPALTKLPGSLTKFTFDGGMRCILPLSFITEFTNLQELELSFYRNYSYEDYEKLQHATFSQLKILRIVYTSPRYGLLIKFLENNGKNLKEFHIGDYSGDCDNSLNLAVAKFCPSLRKLSTGFKSNELETMKIVFNSCRYLESIKIWCSDEFLNEKQALEMILKYSPKNFYELKLDYPDYMRSELKPEELESFFIGWANRITQKSLSLIIINSDSDSFDKIDENMDIIEKYMDLGIIKKFNVLDHDGNDYDYDDDDNDDDDNVDGIFPL
jgi:hypothetical protein